MIWLMHIMAPKTHSSWTARSKHKEWGWPNHASLLYSLFVLWLCFSFHSFSPNHLLLLKPCLYSRLVPKRFKAMSSDFSFSDLCARLLTFLVSLPILTALWTLSTFVIWAGLLMTLVSFILWPDAKSLWHMTFQTCWAIPVKLGKG